MNIKNVPKKKTTRRQSQATIEKRKKTIRKKQRAKKRKAFLRKLAIVCGVIIAILVLVLAVILLKKMKQQEEKPADSSQSAMLAVDLDDVLHLSFSSLIADTEEAFQQEDENSVALIAQKHITVREFNQILQKLYDNRYLLIDIDDLIEVNEITGKIQEKELLIPQGKRPLLLSQQDVSYPLEDSGKGFASKLILDDQGKITCTAKDEYGNLSYGAYDFVACLEAFIETHPDFSYQGARGILGVTGYNGILGYRTNPLLGQSTDNVYLAEHGLFDVEKETADAVKMVEELRSRGWKFACNGYENQSYKTSPDVVKADMELWKAQVEPVIGKTNILLFPLGTDIQNWDTYEKSNQIYTYLEEQGFQVFAAGELSGSWMQLTE